MYEQVAHSLLNVVLDRLKPEIRQRNLRRFYTRLGANFYAIYSLFHELYGTRADFESQIVRLTEVLAFNYMRRERALRQMDMERERDHNWFLSQQWAGMALYADSFAGDLAGLRKRLSYLQELGINLVHVLPILKCPQGASDGGYAVSDFRSIDERVGTLNEVSALRQQMHARGMLLTLDVVVNHTSNQHEWAQRARAGERRYQDYFHVFDSREIPDMFEETLPEIFPETSPGNFTWDEAMGKWVMTVFNGYQWDLNYSNPAVFIEMLDILLFWANQGADILRLDAVAFLWKKLGTTCQNLREAHLILQLFKDCCQVTAPGVLFIAEAIVAPVEITKYFGEDAVIAKECEIAYNATLMALLWDAVATRNAKLLYQGVRNLPVKLDRATWLNYVRCHDDIGLGFEDADIVRAGYDPASHRRFLVDYLTGRYPGSRARGQPFGLNARTGDARVSGSLASLAGLEAALESGNEAEISLRIDLILLLHSVIMSFGGIPLLYCGDEVGALNDLSFREDSAKARDTRWMHRSLMDWERARRRKQRGTVEQRIFDGLKRMIAIRSSTPAFADFNNRDLVESGNPHLFVLLRSNPLELGQHVLAVANFDDAPQSLDLGNLCSRDHFCYPRLRDLYSGDSPHLVEHQLVVPPFGFYWLSDRTG